MMVFLITRELLDDRGGCGSGGLGWYVGLVYAPYGVPTPDCWFAIALSCIWVP